MLFSWWSGEVFYPIVNRRSRQAQPLHNFVECQFLLGAQGDCFLAEVIVAACHVGAFYSKTYVFSADLLVQLTFAFENLQPRFYFGGRNVYVVGFFSVGAGALAFRQRRLV